MGDDGLTSGHHKGYQGSVNDGPTQQVVPGGGAGGYRYRDE